MSDKPIVATTKALTSHIEGLTLSIEPEVIERSYADWQQPLEESPISTSEGLRVDVVAITNAQKIELISRGFKKYTIPIHIAIRRRLGQELQDTDTGRIPTTTVDPYVNYTDELFDSLIPIRLADYEEAAWQGTELESLPDKPLLIQRQFTAVIRVTFTVKKAVTT